MMRVLLVASLLAVQAVLISGLSDGSIRYDWIDREAVGDNPATAYFMSDAVNNGAQCLDGSPAAYYFRAGSDSGAKNWYIHMEGGGWCNSIADCYSRSQTALGSSKSYAKTADLGGGYFSQDPNVNPMMYNWNMVYMKYCDGGSFSGDNATVSYYNGNALYFRGRRNLDAMITDLMTNRGLNNADIAVVSGCSAGGLATFLHVDYYRERLSPFTTVVGMPDSGFFLDYENPTIRYHSQLVWVFQQMNSTGGVNRDCIAYWEAATGETWHCIFAQHTAPFISTPIFPLQAKYDSWQIDNILGTKDPATVNQFGANLTSLVESQLLNTNPAHGIFLDSCYHHCGEWGNIKIDNLVQATAFESWFNGGSEKFYNQDGTFPCSTCCSAKHF